MTIYAIAIQAITIKVAELPLTPTGKTDMRAVSSKNKLSTVSELHAAALAGDLTWVQRVIEPEAEACSILRQVEPEVARRRR